MKLMIEGLDRLGKDTLIDGIQHKLGFHQVIHFSKPRELACYQPWPTGMSAAEIRSEALFQYQRASFSTMFSLFTAKNVDLIANRAHLGECVYAPLYRGYDGGYVFDLEAALLQQIADTRLILLTEDFSVSQHFVDDGESFDITKREKEQELFIAAFERSNMQNKRIICVTDRGVGGFRRREDILAEAIE